jgi:hypothetical protein
MGRAGLMGTRELDEMQALLEHVLPDPSGYAQRLAMQAMARWGESAGPTAGAFSPAATARDVTVSDIVVAPDQEPADDPSIDTNMLLAAALGACECWGLWADCSMCRGQGSAGWTHPDPELFDEFVRPAVAKMSGTSADGHKQHGSVNAETDTHQTAQGENP